MSIIHGTIKNIDKTTKATVVKTRRNGKRLPISSQGDGGFYMWTNSFVKWLLRPTSLIFRLCVFCLVAVVPVLRAQSDEEFDSYKLKLEGFWVYANPSGSLQSSVQTGMGPIDLQKDLGFNNYSTFMGKLDWKFTHKNHLYIAGEAFKSSRQTVLTRTITFQGQTFEAGLTTQSNLDAPMYVRQLNHVFCSAKQYDHGRNKHGMDNLRHSAVPYVDPPKLSRDGRRCVRGRPYVSAVAATRSSSEWLANQRTARPHDAG